MRSELEAGVGIGRTLFRCEVPKGLYLLGKIYAGRKSASVIKEISGTCGSVSLRRGQIPVADVFTDTTRLQNHAVVSRPLMISNSAIYLAGGLMSAVAADLRREIIRVV